MEQDVTEAITAAQQKETMRDVLKYHKRFQPDFIDESTDYTDKTVKHIDKCSMFHV